MPGKLIGCVSRFIFSFLQLTNSTQLLLKFHVRHHLEGFGVISYEPKVLANGKFCEKALFVFCNSEIVITHNVAYIRSHFPLQV